MSKSDKIAGWLASQAKQGSPSPTPETELSFEPRDTPIIEALLPSAITDESGCIILEHRQSIPVSFALAEESSIALLSDLRLLFGIGARYADRLRADGYDTIDSLRSHPRWGTASAALLDRWGTPFDPIEVYRTLARWLPASSPGFLRLLSLISPSDLLFFDLETLGLGGAPVILAAIGRFEPDGFLVRQYLAPSPAEEIALLELLRRDIRAATGLLSYNGKSFDWTVLKERFAYYGLSLPRVEVHVDLLHQARRAWRDELGDCHLGTIEESVLGVRRDADLPSEQVPLYYTMYLETGHPGPLVPIVNHNRQDIISLGLLLDRLLRMNGDA